jgi:hypothetical protein
LSDPTLPSEVISLLLSNHFPESIHEDILAAVHLDQVPTAKPKRDARFREEVLRAYGYCCAVCGFNLRLDNVPRRAYPVAPGSWPQHNLERLSSLQFASQAFRSWRILVI